MYEESKKISTEELKKEQPIISPYNISTNEEKISAISLKNNNPTKEETTKTETKPLRWVYVPSLLFGVGISLFFYFFGIFTGNPIKSDFFIFVILNTFIYGAIYSLFILIWRRFYKKTVISIKSPDSGLEEVLIHAGCIIILVLVLSFSLLTPAFSSTRTTALTSYRTLEGCDPSIVGKWEGWENDYPSNYDFLNFEPNGKLTVHVQGPDTNELYSVSYRCVDSQIYLNERPSDYSINNGVLIISGSKYTRK